ncbi:MAG: prepilin-type N-terminal cleavage/methylation domain-containing protein, partial [Patescibacteria group bacterium]
MSFPTEQQEQQRRRSYEGREAREERESHEDKENPEAKAAAAMERAELITKEIKQTKKQMQNIVLHMQEVARLIREIRQELRLAESDAEDHPSIARDAERMESLRKKIQEYQKELSAMRGDLIREQMEELKNGVGVGMSTDELRVKAEEMVERMMQMVPRGFSIIEILVALGIFAIFAVGIYSGIQFAFQVVYQSKLRIMESGIAIREVEFIRNLPYTSVGITDGIPVGILERSSTTTEGGIDFLVRRTVRNVDDPFDGVNGGNPNDTDPADY